MAESALLAVIPEAEPLVGRFRAAYDSSAAAGVPAHVTVLYPFKPPAELTDDVQRQLAALFAECPAFDAAFPRTGRFPDVLYLAPDPAASFRQLTERVAALFPENPPYRGQFTTITPHLTVAAVDDALQLAGIAGEFDAAAAGKLPVRSRVTQVALMHNATGRWEIYYRFDLNRKLIP